MYRLFLIIKVKDFNLFFYYCSISNIDKDLYPIINTDSRILDFNSSVDKEAQIHINTISILLSNIM